MLHQNGRTAHSTFIIPLQLDSVSCYAVDLETKHSEILREVDYVVWDQAPMTHRHAFEAVDRLFQDSCSPLQLSYNPKLHVKSENFKPEPCHRDIEDVLEGVRDNLFVQELQRRKEKNLSRLLRITLERLKARKDLKVIPTDKNLGPALMTSMGYIDMCETHLSKGQYVQLPSKHLPIIEGLMREEAYDFASSIPKQWCDPKDTKIITHRIEEKSINTFYGMPKIHKDGPLKPRPVSSNAGTILDGTSKFLDVQLQPFLGEIPSYIKDSDTFLDNLRSTEFVDKASIRTFDVVSMYRIFLSDKMPLCDYIDRGLKVVMEKNYLLCNHAKRLVVLTFIFGGDFPQILQAVPKGTRSQTVSASLKASSLWKSITTCKLTTNMRLQHGDDPDEAWFADWQLRIGEGFPRSDLGLQTIPQTMTERNVPDHR